MEDRIRANGRLAEYESAYHAFENSSRRLEQQKSFHGKLLSVGTTAEEADEFIRLILATYVE